MTLRARGRGRLGVALLAAGVLAAAALGLVGRFAAGPDAVAPRADPAPDAADAVARGAYLALAGNCAGCHTARGGEPYAGGRAIATPFGTIHATNLTPDVATGLGAWTADDFWRAMHEGRSRDGRALYPAFPYTDYTRIGRADADALWAYLRTLAPVSAPARPHALRFPWSLPLLLEGWRLLYFRPAAFEPDPTRDAAWNRGAYLVTGLGHCGACHTARDALGGPAGEPLGGGELAALGWYAPSLRADAEGGVAGWPIAETADWLASGIGTRGIATGPMAEVVERSLQHLVPEDRRAMAIYLQSIATRDRSAAGGGATRTASRGGGAVPPAAGAADEGERLYRRHCEDCHGAAGEGAPPHYPALAGNRVLAMASPVNAIRSVLHGGFAPGTRANPRPYGMPPFGPELDDREAAALLTWLRARWGEAAAPVAPREVNRLRPVPVE
jgi:mono/diheme cytochrome c family protein